MAKGYKVGDPIEFRVRCDGDPTTDNPTVLVYDEIDGVFATLTLGSGLTQIGATKTVKGSFTPDENGMWQISAADDAGLDIIKAYAVGDYSIDANGALGATVDGKVDAQDLQMAADQAALLNALAAINAAVGGGGGHFG